MVAYFQCEIVDEAFDHVGTASRFNSAVAGIAGLVATALRGFVLASQGSAEAFRATLRLAAAVGETSAALAAGCAVVLIRPRMPIPERPP